MPNNLDRLHYLTDRLIEPLNILIIEDIESETFALVAAIQSISPKATIDTAFDALEGIHLLTPRKYDLLMLNLKLPGSLSGIDVLRYLNTWKPEDRPFVCIVTGMDYEDALKQCSPFGSLFVFSKPFSLLDIHKALIAAKG